MRVVRLSGERGWGLRSTAVVVVLRHRLSCSVALCDHVALDVCEGEGEGGGVNGLLGCAPASVL